MSHPLSGGGASRPACLFACRHAERASTAGRPRSRGAIDSAPPSTASRCPPRRTPRPLPPPQRARSPEVRRRAPRELGRFRRMRFAPLAMPSFQTFAQSGAFRKPKPSTFRSRPALPRAKVAPSRRISSHKIYYVKIRAGTGGSKAARVRVAFAVPDVAAPLGLNGCESRNRLAWHERRRSRTDDDYGPPASGVLVPRTHSRASPRHFHRSPPFSTHCSSF